MYIETTDGQKHIILSNRKETKQLLEALGFVFDQYNKIYTKDGASVRCIVCKRWITLKTFGMTPRGANTMICSHYSCIVVYKLEFKDEDNTPTPTGIKGYGAGV